MKFKYINMETGNSGKIAVISINRPPDNSINMELMNELISAHDVVEKNHEFKALILTSSVKGYFSNGLDVDHLLDTDRTGKLKIFETLYLLCQKIYSFKKIHVNLINGHAMAGGAIIASMSDFRFMSSGPFRFCFSEVKMGIIIPEIFLGIIRDFSKAGLYEIVLQARAYKPHEAFEAGLVNGIFTEDEIYKKTIKFVTGLIEAPMSGYLDTKQIIRKNNIEQFEKSKEQTLKVFSGFLNEDFNKELEKIRKRRNAKWQ